jgi:hypothetical protein
MNDSDDIYAKFPIKSWYPLTEIPPCYQDICPENGATSDAHSAANKAGQPPAVHPNLQGVSAALIKLLWDLLVYPFGSISVRVKRLGTSARTFESAKREGYEKGLLIETANGQTTYLIPTEKAFEAFNMPCPYNRRAVSIQHSFRVGLLQFLLSHDPCYKKVFIEYPLDQGGSTADVATLRHDGGKEGWEVTISTTNVVSNLQKYETVNFVKVVFVAPDYRLKEAAKATVLGAGLNSDLLARVEFRHFSQLLQQQRRLSLY